LDKCTNNCIGCVKGGLGYWNLIRKHFPEAFDKMAKQERILGASIHSSVYLDQLEEYRGRIPKPEPMDCGPYCVSSDKPDEYEDNWKL